MLLEEAEVSSREDRLCVEEGIDLFSTCTLAYVVVLDEEVAILVQCCIHLTKSQEILDCCIAALCCLNLLLLSRCHLTRFVHDTLICSSIGSVAISSVLLIAFLGLVLSVQSLLLYIFRL